MMGKERFSALETGTPEQNGFWKFAKNQMVFDVVHLFYPWFWFFLYQILMPLLANVAKKVLSILSDPHVFPFTAPVILNNRHLWLVSICAIFWQAWKWGLLVFLKELFSTLQADSSQLSCFKLRNYPNVLMKMSSHGI